MADCNHSYFTHYCSYLYHTCNYQSLQNQIDQLKQNEETNADSKFTKFYQNQIDKLKNANNAQLNNENQSKVNNMLEDINTKFDSIKAKLENILNGSNSGN